MLRGEGKVQRSRGGRGQFAFVSLEVDSSASAGVEFPCSVEHDVWKSGAEAGIEFALKTAGSTHARVIVNRITGLTTDTSPTLVAVVAAIATWNAIGFTPRQEVMDRMEQMILMSPIDFDAVPKFE